MHLNLILSLILRIYTSSYCRF